MRQSLIDRGDAIAYFEPENTVMSRSGDECIVALTDQWYLSYGESTWQQAVLDHIRSASFSSYNAGVLDSFEKSVDWLKEWACSREFGLGTQLPWDLKWVIDSLSDSTIYMAYYTIAHHFHGDGSDLKGSFPWKAEEFTDEVFSYIFLGKDLPQNYTGPIPTDVLQKMKTEFEYWYPMDLRVSAKDLIPNHLTMCLYNHIAIWKDQPDMWPRGMYCNGHIMVDAEKMSKSKGNFLMMQQCVDEFSADATRFALADAGDSLEDANFDRSVANKAIIDLFTEEEWIKGILIDTAEGKLRGGSDEKHFMDLAFENEVDYLIEEAAKEFDKICFRDGIHRCWFDMMIARDFYRDWAQKCEVPLHATIIRKFIESVVVMISPICPHWADNIWEMLGNKGSVAASSWPSFNLYDKHLRKQYSFFRDFIKASRLAVLKQKVNGPKGGYIYVSSTYDSNKTTVLEFMQDLWKVKQSFDQEFPRQLKSFLESNPTLKPETKNLMQFGAYMRDEALDRGFDALSTEIPFDQLYILTVSRTVSLFLLSNPLISLLE